MPTLEPDAGKNQLKRVVVYSEANMNAIDGSSVWVQATSLALAGIPSVRVDLLLSHSIQNGLMIEPLLAHPRVNVIEPRQTLGKKVAEPMGIQQAGKLITSMIEEGSTAVVVRGAEAAVALAGFRSLRGLIWPYLTDVPQRVEDIDELDRRRIAVIMSASPVLLCQTEELALFMEDNFAETRGKGFVLPPMIPNDMASHVSMPDGDQIELCYAGKFAPAWKTLEMCELPKRLSERGISARLTMIGDKINRDPHWTGFVAEMRRRLTDTHGINWVGGVSRKRAIELMALSNLGLSWRSKSLDKSLELSTKLLEYCATGTPPVVNRNPMHERILAPDYPFFVDERNSVLDAIELAVREPSAYRRALEMTSDLVAEFTIEAASKRLEVLTAQIPSPAKSSGTSTLAKRLANWFGQ